MRGRLYGHRGDIRWCGLHAGNRQGINRADVGLVVIGPGWISASGIDGIRRLDEDRDFCA